MPESVPAILVSEEVARWLVEQHAKTSTAYAFTDSQPHFCKLCDRPVAAAEQAAHLRGHREQLQKMRTKRERERVRRLREVNRLRRKASS